VQTFRRVTQAEPATIQFMLATIKRERLLRLLREWRKLERVYYAAAYTHPQRREAPLDRARYEGGALGLRWCVEDMEQLLKARKRRAR
jgi:hypothetical protein